VALDNLTTDRARRALSHGGGIDGILFMLLAGAGIGLAVVLIVAGLQTAETQATRAAGQSQSTMNRQAAEIGNL